jgi:L-iditol 2-dehydrogenase
MKALVLEDYMKFRYKEVPKPEIMDDEVLIEIKAAGICGSDVHGIDGSNGRRIPPIIMGHEASGIIVQRGKNIKEWEIGTRVTFDSTIYKLDDWYSRKGMYNLSDGRIVLGVSSKEFKRDGAHAEYIAVPQHILYKIPDNITFTQAAMVEPVAVALHAVELTKISVSDIAVVVGSGKIGLFVIQILKVAGCRRIVAVDIKEDRLKLAHGLGADLVLNPEKTNVTTEVQNLSEGRGADIAFEVVGISSATNTAINCLRKGGTLTLVGNLSPKIELPLQIVVTRQLRLQGSCAINGEYPAVLNLISSGKIDVSAIMSAEAPLSQGAEWFKRLYNKEPGLIKVILIPGR